MEEIKNIVDLEENTRKYNYSLIVATKIDDTFKVGQVYKIPFLQRVNVGDYVIVDTINGDKLAEVNQVIEFVNDDIIKLIETLKNIQEKDISQVLYTFRREIMKYED